MTGCCGMWGGVLSAQLESMLDDVCMWGGHCLPQSLFPQMVQGYPGQGFPQTPLGWAGRGRPVGLRGRPFSASQSPQPELGVRPLGVG